MSHCAVLSCKTSIYNKAPGVSLHSCPTSTDMRNKWLLLLKNKCPALDWSASKICSKHFEHRYFDSQRKLKDNAIPTLFPVQPSAKAAIKIGNVKSDGMASVQRLSINLKTEPSPATKTKMDRILSKMTQSQLMADIKNTTSKLREPLNLNEFITQGLQCQSDAPMEAKLWLLIKKQEHLNTRLMELVVKNKKSSDIVKKSLEEEKTSKKELEKSLETYKYIVKCLQEKQATLEEQVEILSAVESR